MQTRIVTALHRNYVKKSEPLFKSLVSNGAGCSLHAILIDTKHKIPGIKTSNIDLKNVGTYKSDWPENRDFYVCLEGGEFLKYMDHDDDDLIIHIDSDMIMQRPFTDKEKSFIANIKKDELFMVSANTPYDSLEREAEKLLPVNLEKNHPLYRYCFGEKSTLFEKPTYCAALIIARAKTFKKMNAFYNNYFNDLTKSFRHHAAGQWLISWIAHYKLIARELPQYYNCATWYKGVQHSIKDNKLYHDDKMVIFNHTKFDPMWG